MKPIALYVYIIRMFGQAPTVTIEPLGDWATTEGNEIRTLEAGLFPAPPHLGAPCMRMLEGGAEGESVYIGTDQHGRPVVFESVLDMSIDNIRTIA